MDGFSSPRETGKGKGVSKDIHITDIIDEQGTTQEIYLPRQSIEVLISSVREHNTDTLLQLFVEAAAGDYQDALRSSCLQLAINTGFNDPQIVELFQKLNLQLSSQDRAVADGIVQYVTDQAAQ